VSAIVVLTANHRRGILIIQFGELQLPGTSKYTIYIDFQQAPGITVEHRFAEMEFPSGGSGMSSASRGMCRLRQTLTGDKRSRKARFAASRRPPCSATPLIEPFSRNGILSS